MSINNELNLRLKNGMETKLNYMHFSKGDKEYIIRLQNHDSFHIKKIYRIMTMAESRKVNVQAYNIIKGKPYFKYMDKIYTLNPYYSVSANYKVKELGKLIAGFHKIKGVKLPQSKIYKEFQKEYRLIRYYKDLISFKKIQGDREELMRKIIDISEESIEESNATLSSNKVIEKIDRDVMNKSIVHRGLGKSGVLTDSYNNLCISTMELAHNGTPMEDVSEVINLLINKHMDSRKVMDFLEGYDSIKSISDMDGDILIALLRYPRRLFHMLDKYTLYSELTTKELKDYIVDIPITNKIISSIERQW